MSTSLLPDFPKKTRGTYRIKSDEDGSEAEKLQAAKKRIEIMASQDAITIILDAKMQGNRWVLMWWPSNEPRHQETDQIIN